MYGKSPWSQERHVIGMLKSPVEGSTLVLIKLSSPVIFSNFIRPVCLPLNSASSEDLVYCNALGWSESSKYLRVTKTQYFMQLRMRVILSLCGNLIISEVLQRIEIKETQMDSCAEMSIMMHNGLCASSAFDIEECSVSCKSFTLSTLVKI